MAAELAYQFAQLQNPSGEVSRQAYERSLDAITGGTFANNASALAGVTGFREMLGSKRIQVDRLRNPQQVKPHVTPSPQASGRRKFDESGNPL